jgi:hypothetical protein
MTICPAIQLRQTAITAKLHQPYALPARDFNQRPPRAPRQLMKHKQPPRKMMQLGKAIGGIGFVIAVVLLSNSAKAALIDFTFTGTGSNGSIASGSFSVDEGAIQPGYFATGGIFPSLSLSMIDIPGGGPTSADFDANDLPFTWFYVDANSVVYIAPYGSKSYGPPDENHYDLGQPSQPFPSSYIYETGLSYNGSARDTIDWSVATPVPEPGTAFLFVSGVVAGAYVLRRQARPVPLSSHI